MSFYDALEGYWLSKKEAQVYLSTLELWHAPIASIARHSGLNRTTVYDILEWLKKKWIASLITKWKIQYCMVITPDVIFQNFQQKYFHFQSHLSELMQLANKYDNKSQVQFYEWLEGVKQMYRQQLTWNITHIKAFLGIEHIDPLLKEFLDTEFIPKRLEKNIYAQVIWIDNEANQRYKDMDALRNKKTKLIKTSIINFSCQIDIHNTGELYFIGWGTSSMFAVKIKNPYICDSIEKLFDFIWDGA